MRALAPTLADMTDTPFFEPWPQPEVDPDSEEREVDLPWLPPAHVAGVVVPLAADVVHGDEVVVRVTHVVAYQRGIEVHVGTWLRPGARRDPSDVREVWREQEPRVGVRRSQRTPRGARAPPADAARPGPSHPAPARAPSRPTAGWRARPVARSGR